MAKGINRDEGVAYRKRWEALAHAERAELRSVSLEVKLRQAAALMASVEPLGWTEALKAEEAEVRARWLRLKEVLRGKE